MDRCGDVRGRGCKWEFDGEDGGIEEVRRDEIDGDVVGKKKKKRDDRYHRLTLLPHSALSLL